MDLMLLDGRHTLILAILVLFLGKWLTARFALLRDYNIPEPVAGGLIASLGFGLLYLFFGLRFEFDLDLRDEMLIAFFTTIGLSSRFETLRKGGAQLAVLLLVAIVYLGIQNGTGVLVTTLAGVDALVGIIGGSISLFGGHGTAIAWAPVFMDNHGVALANEIGIACATFGLVLGGILGGPLARFLIKRHALSSDSNAMQTVGIEYESSVVPVNYQAMLRAILVLSVAITLGTGIDYALEELGIQLPTFVSCLFAGILVTNIGPRILPHTKMPRPEHSRSLAVSRCCLTSAWACF